MLSKKSNIKQQTVTPVYDRKKILKNLYTQCEEYNPISITFTNHMRASSLLNLSEIKTPHLRFIYSRDFNSTECELERIKQYCDKRNYESEMVLAFWLAVHIESLQITKLMLSKNSLLRRIITSACNRLDAKGDIKEDNTEGRIQEKVEKIIQNAQIVNKMQDSDYSYQTHSHTSIVYPSNYKFMTNEQKKKYVEEVKQKMQNELIQQTINLDLQNFSSSLNVVRDAFQNKTKGGFLSSRLKLIEEERLDLFELETRDDLRRFKNDLKLRYATLMTQILKIALQKGEEMIASIISIYYKTDIDMEILKQAILEEKYEWIHNLWAFQKNFIGIEEKQNHQLITYDKLFEMIFTYNQYHNATPRIKDICKWNLNTKDNLLISLINHKQDDLAIEFMGIYKNHVDKHLFIFCLDIGNTDFLQTALTLNAFDQLIFRNTEVMNKIINILREGHRTNFLLNVLCLSDIAIFKIKHIQQLIQVLQDFSGLKYEKNSLLLCSNPMLAICLAAELAEKIGKTRRMFSNECMMIKDELMKLGKMYTAKIQDEKYYEKLVFDTDITGRSVLKIITINQLAPLMEENDAKAGSSMLKLWDGKEAYKCDGQYQDLSSIVYLILSPIKRIIPQKKWLFNLITNGFEANLKVDYKIQYKYRSKQISFYYIKELLCAILMLVTFQNINYRYTNIQGVDIDNLQQQYLLQQNSQLTLEEYEKNYEQEQIVININSLHNLLVFALVLSSSQMLQIVMKIIFNLSTKKAKLSIIDKWTIMDLICGALNFIAHLTLLKSNPSELSDHESGNIMDVFMIFVLLVSWIRFLMLFLANSMISNIFHILIGLLKEILFYLILLGCYLLIIASVFTALFYHLQPDKFGTIGQSFRILFDAMLASYTYEIQEEKYVFTVLIMTHILLSNIILFNFLIAVFTTSYSTLHSQGLFVYKCNLYEYCERYLVSFNDDAYGQFIIHPPPLNFLTIFFSLPLAFSPSISKKSQILLSYITFWLENVVMIIIHFTFEVICSPIAYLKVFYNFFNTNNDILFMTICSIIWICIGPVILMWLICLDTFHLVKVLSMHQGCREGLVDELEEERIEEKKKLILYNETRAAIISIYEKIKNRLDAEIQKQGYSSDLKLNFFPKKIDSTSDMVSEFDDITTLNNNQQYEEYDYYKVNETQNQGQLFIVSKSIIIREWKKRKNERLRNESKNGKMYKTPYMSNIQKVNLNQNIQQQQQPTNSVFKSRTMLTTMVQQQQQQQQQQIFQNKEGIIKRPLTNKQITIKKQQKHSQIIEDFFQNQEQYYQDDIIEIAEEDIKIVENFLKQFTIVSESSSNDHIDIVLFLKAIPSKITSENIEKIELFNFKIFQEALIAYQNIFIVNAFEYFDDKNRERTIGLKDKLTQHKLQLNDLTLKVDSMRQKFDRNEDLLVKISEAVQTSNLKEEIQTLTQKNFGDGYFGDSVSRMHKLAEALQRMAEKCKQQEYQNLGSSRKNTQIQVQNIDSTKNIRHHSKH